MTELIENTELVQALEIFTSLETIVMKFNSCNICSHPYNFTKTALLFPTLTEYKPLGKSLISSSV